MTCVTFRAKALTVHSSHTQSKLEIQIDLCAPIGSATLRIIGSALCHIWSAWLARSLSKGYDLCDLHTGIEQVLFNDFRTAQRQTLVVIIRSLRIGVAA